MTSVLIGAVAAGVLGLVASWVLRRRDEAKLGGAAERRLHAYLQDSLDVLDDGRPSAAWLNPGIRVTVWHEQFDHLVPRFRPHFWDEINGVVDTLDRMQAWAERTAEEGVPPADPPDARQAREAIAKTQEIVAELDRRYDRWKRFQPWLKKQSSLATRVAWRVLATVLAVGALGLVTALAESQLDDPIASSDIEKEIRQMQPDVKLVNCAGADTKDRWTCTLITSACRTAAVVPKPCAPVEAETRLQADAQSSNDMIWVRLINRSLERAGQPESV